MLAQVLAQVCANSSKKEVLAQVLGQVLAQVLVLEQVFGRVLGREGAPRQEPGPHFALSIRETPFRVPRTTSLAICHYDPFLHTEQNALDGVCLLSAPLVA